MVKSHRTRKRINIEALLQNAIEALSRLDQLWEEATAEKKRLIIGSIYPEKLVFDGKRFQTARLNEGARLIYTLNKGLEENETGQRETISALSSSVTGLDCLRRSLYSCKGLTRNPTALLSSDLGFCNGPLLLVNSRRYQTQKTPTIVGALVTRIGQISNQFSNNIDLRRFLSIISMHLSVF